MSPRPVRRSAIWFAFVGLATSIWAGRTLAADVPVAGRALGIHNDPAPEDVTRRRITWSASDAGIVTGLPGSSGDPRCVGAGGSGSGGTIRFFSDRSAGSTEDTGDIALPCQHWTALGSATSPKGYSYRDPDHDQGPCERVVVMNGRKAKATCSAKIEGLAYDLVEGVDQGRVATVLRVGATDG